MRTTQTEVSKTAPDGQDIEEPITDQQTIRGES